MKKKLLALFLCCALSFGLVTAALINALRVVGKKMEDVHRRCGLGAYDLQRECRCGYSFRS